jgi:hypothetical protein
VSRAHGSSPLPTPGGAGTKCATLRGPRGTREAPGRAIREGPR